MTSSISLRWFILSCCASTWEWSSSNAEMKCHLNSMWTALSTIGLFWCRWLATITCRRCQNSTWMLTFCRSFTMRTRRSWRHQMVGIFSVSFFLSFWNNDLHIEWVHGRIIESIDSISTFKWKESKFNGQLTHKLPSRLFPFPGYMSENGLLNVRRFARLLQILKPKDFDLYSKSIVQQLAAINLNDEVANGGANGGEPKASFSDFLEMKDEYYAQHLGTNNLPNLNQMSTSYVTTVQWILFYYFRGTFSWTYHYPFKCVPFVSDFSPVHHTAISMEIDKPVKPFTHLLAILPEGSAHLLPKSYQMMMVHVTEDKVSFHFFLKIWNTSIHGPTYKIDLFFFCFFGRMTCCRRLRSLKNNWMHPKKAETNRNQCSNCNM